MSGEDLRGPSTRLVGGITALVLLTCAGYFFLWRGAPSIRTDSGSYLAVAEDLSDLDLDAWPARAPLYPALILAVGGGSAEPGRLLFAVQLALHAAATLLLLALMRGCRVHAAWLVLVAVHQLLPSALLKTSFVLSETLSQLLVVLAVWGLNTAASEEVRGRWKLVVACVALAVAPLSHPVFRLLAPVLSVTLVALSGLGGRAQRRFLYAALGVLGTWMLVVPGWSAYVDGRFDSPGPVSTAERLLNKLGGVVESLPEDGDGFRKVLLEERDRRLLESRDHRVDGYVVRAWPRLVELSGGDERRAHARVRRAALHLLRLEPRAYARAVAASAIRFWEVRREPMPGFQGRIWGLANLLGGTLEALAWIGLAVGFGLLVVVVGTLPGGGAELLWGRMERRRRQLFLALAAVVLIYVFLVAVAVGTGVPRYRWPVHGLSIAAAAVALDTAFGFRSRLRRALARPETAPRAADREEA